MYIQVHNHNHESHCKHEMAHCEVCDIAYCKLCQKEWGRKYSFWSYPYTTSPWYGTGYGTVSNDQTVSIPLTLCSHLTS